MLLLQVAGALLDYCMSDIDTSDANSVKQLVSLPLCATSDGGLQPLAGSGMQARYILTPEEHVLLSHQPALIVHWQVCQQCLNEMSAC